MSVPFGDDGEIRLQHSLAFADDLHRRVIINRESATVVAMSLGLDIQQTKGAVRLLRSLPAKPSPERLALVVMRDYGLDNRDIAEIFGRSPRWAYLVREREAELREAEPIRWDLEYLDDGLQPGDPSPMEILEQAEALRVAGTYRSRLPSHRRELNALVQECA
jgi:hypothetical protein